MKKNLKQFGQYLKALRIQKELSLRNICKKIGYDPSNWSKIERGVISPPSDEKILTKWAGALGLLEASKELHVFIDEAKISQGIIPQDILEQKNAVKYLPAFFRTLRNKKPTKKEIDDLIRLIRKV